VSVSDTDEVLFNPFDPAFRADPYAAYARILAEAPVHRSPLGAWVFARYADCQTVLRHPGTSMGSMFANESEREMLLRAQGMWEDWEASMVPEFMDTVILTQDPPDHTRQRAVMAKVFTPRAVEALRPHIQQLVDDLLAEVEEGIDVIADLAFPLPALVICEMLGVPVEDRDELKEWSSAAARLLDPLMNPQTFREADHGLRQFTAYFTALIAERRRQPKDDLLTQLIEAEADDGHTLSDSELTANATFLFGAGHETTQNLIGNGVLLLARHPDQRQLLHDDPELARNAVEEFLRYEPPVQVTGRSITAPVKVGQLELEAGDRCVMLLAAANRDPERFEDPTRLDVTRADVRPLSFGGGIHHCLGAALARVEGQVAIGTLVREFPTIELESDEIEWKDTFTLRGPKTLSVSLSR
jgi:pimeloyl-[acyl-carrier protein] synthase